MTLSIVAAAEKERKVRKSKTTPSLGFMILNEFSTTSLSFTTSLYILGTFVGGH